MNHRNEGFVLPMGLLMMGLLSVLVSGYLLLMTSELQMAKHGLGRANTYALCEVAVAKAIESLNANPNWTAGFSSIEYPSASGNYYSVTASKSGETVILIATGIAQSLYQRSIKVTLMVPAVVTTSQPVRIDQWENL